mmetsp:Transcript_25184/g.45344  ORF Transcript_25184/g.45344 Transcript_25184/m.45344 type:complete len:198 (-) Transcript_25184:70-663(-)|eukprot:CAMPEP_0201916726 /NCGR_PEP_ID=MMETSP0903-20130614/6303_1 /ASSEMBLY_ACC=CAM_ASM_000552 /TAXON_ID=420261 /ORGANISM="Thalassiosira antarctica, Strain CCMP982" /LENGTH=197 /DNA_ID=CAMNT_0048452633 /DNA_START=114 /DNA_END=707 /DNA_ORIENTATION=-
MNRFQLSLLSWALLLSPSSAFVTTPESKRYTSIIDTKSQSTFGTTNHEPITSNKHQCSLNLSSTNDPTEQLTGNREKAWRHAKKPLLRIGGKGATKAHGNSLRQLLDQHTVVKVKINTGPFDGSLQKAFDILKELAVEAGADAGVELIHIRTSEKVIMFGREGALGLIDGGDFPPPPPPPYVPKEREPYVYKEREVE